ncbi:ATP-binding cassette domain-containing protein [Sphingomonas olei]|uniref:ATP-binding cassette domain-containing protein n=1 Tax=Sphingomonas olei TaxID=1886787 RepID=A0ABY2QHX4_9SPHN|nr:ATP-binding cassette domain-containing protein [Sphingomonas olei]
MIRLSGVRKVYRTRFGDNVVLDGIDLELRMGERLGILGRNGAGKSTMVRLISGAERQTAGRIERTMSVSWPLAFGGAFQQNLTGVDNVRFISRVYDQDFARNLAFVEDFSELGPYLREPVRTYSSGMRARLAFAISMIIEFDCFLIDEIGAVGDARFHDRCNYELFGKRGDRAMVLISHDAGYVRDHCNRFALLHQGKLALYDDFETAYGEFRERIGLIAAPVIDHSTTADRGALIEVAQHRALQDERFTMLVREGDWLRDERRWGEAEERYAAALALHPYQRSYWVQHAHVAKEDGDFQRAEASYRTACAFGEPVHDVIEHLAFVLSRQGIEPAAWPVHPYVKGPVKNQVPGGPDITVLARLLWDEEAPETEVVALLRRHATFDDLLFDMLSHERVRGVHEPWLRHAREHGVIPRDLAHGGGTEGSAAGSDAADWARTVCVIALSESSDETRQQLIDGIVAGQAPLPLLITLGGFADWPLTQAALQHLVAPQTEQ